MTEKEHRPEEEEFGAATSPGRRAMLERYERLVDPEGLLSPPQRAKLAENARQAHMAEGRRKALKASREHKGAMGDGDVA